MTPQVKKHRSPSYPAISLIAAVKLVEKLYPAARHALGVDVIAQQLGYKGLNSCASQIAAVKQFGLLREEKGGSDRMLRLTDWGLDVGVDPDGNSPQRLLAIERAARNPTLYAELWDKWQASFPPDAEMCRYLERERAFNPKHVSSCIEDYKSTLEFAGLAGDAIIEKEKKESEVENHGNGNIPSITTDKTPSKTKAPAMTPSLGLPVAEAGPFISFPLPAGNIIEIRLRSKVSKKDFERIKKLVDLCEPALVEDSSDTSAASGKEEAGNTVD
jgi:hypothetical protein